MATYAYKCTNEECTEHDKIWEIKQSMKDDALTYCTKCETESLVRVIQKTDFSLKGQGWYKTGGY